MKPYLDSTLYFQAVFRFVLYFERGVFRRTAGSPFLEVMAFTQTLAEVNPSLLSVLLCFCSAVRYSVFFFEMSLGFCNKK